MHATWPRRRRWICVLAAGLFAFAARADGTLPVAATANLFRAGGNSPASAGTDPALATLGPNAAGDTLRFPSVTGTTDCDGAASGCAPTGPDGTLDGNVSAPKLGAIAGIAYRGAAALPLLGVLLGPDLDQPLSFPLDFRQAEGFASLAPELGQPFWIGDGLTGTGSGAPHQFLIPAGATRLFLGFYDPAIADDTGSLTVHFTVAEPSQASLAAVLALAACQRARCRRSAT